MSAVRYNCGHFLIYNITQIVQARHPNTAKYASTHLKSIFGERFLTEQCMSVARPTRMQLRSDVFPLSVRHRSDRLTKDAQPLPWI